MNDTKPTSVYQYFDRWGTLIYVGITARNTSRQREHNQTKEWWPLVDHQTIEHYGTRDEALSRETELIKFHTPPFNTSQNPHWRQVRSAYGDLLKASNAGSLVNQMKSATDKRFPLRIVGREGAMMMFATGVDLLTIVPSLDAPQGAKVILGNTVCGRVMEADRCGPTYQVKAQVRKTVEPYKAFARYKVHMAKGGPRFEIRNVLLLDASARSLEAAA